MPVANITRRGLLLGAIVSSLVAAHAPQAQALLPLHGGTSHAVATGTTTSLTFVNSSASATSSDVPIQAMQWFEPGIVPAGSIAVPTIGGVIDQVYQADNRLYWGDGSLQGAVFRIAHSTGYSAGQSTAYQFVVRSGSYSNTSTKTTADITGVTDYKVTLSNVHTAQPTYIADKLVTLTIGGGQVTGGKLWFPATTTIGTTNVQNGGGASGQISVSGSTVTVVSPGSGYANVGSGTFDISFNDIITAINSGGNHTNGLSIEYYATGPVCLGVRVRAAIPGMPHGHVTFYVEAWYKANGTFLDFRRCAVVGNGMYDTTNAIYNYTYDLDFKDGTTVIVGANGGDARYQTLMNFVGASCGTFDVDGLPYWASANDAAWKAVSHERTATECDVFKKTGVILPYKDDITITLATPTIHASFGSGEQGTEEVNICDYQPFGNAGIRSPLGGGGNGDQEAPMQEIDGIYWMLLRQGQTAKARVFRKNIRVSALHCMSMSQLGGGVFEPTTLYPPNVIPTSKQVFSGMTPTRETVWLGNVTDHGYAHPLLASSAGLVTSYSQSAYNTYHAVDCRYGAFILESDQWLLDEMVYAATSPAIGRFFGSSRQVTLGTTTYYGTLAGASTNTRDATWAFNAAAKAAICSPTTWADGSPNVVQSYCDFLVQSQYSYLLALVPWIGTVKYGTAGATLTKNFDFTGKGQYPDVFQSGVAGTECSVGFMENYELMELAQNNWLMRGKTTGTVLQNYLNYRKNYFVKVWTGSNPHYMVESYRTKVMTAGPGSAPIDFSSGFDASNPTVGAVPAATPGSGGSYVLMTSDGSTTITLSSSIQIGPVGTRLGNGSRVMVTSTNISAAKSANPVTPPSGLDPTVWYYYHELSPTTCELCTDAGLTSPVATVETKAGFYFWIVPSNSPADSAGYGTSNGGTDNSGNSRIQQRIGPLCMAKAYGMGDDANGNLTAALATLDAIAASLGGINFAGNVVEYAWDRTRG